MNRRVLIYLIILAASAFVSTASYASDDKAVEFIQAIKDKVLLIVQSSDSDANKKQKLNDIFVSSVDTRWIGKFVLARSWRQLDEITQQEYLDVYSKFLAHSYVPRFKDYNGQKMMIHKTISGEDHEYVVVTSIVPEDGPPIAISYKIHNDSDGVMKIYDVIAEGVSLLNTQRSEFQSVISRRGFDFFFNRLVKRVQVAAR